MEHFSRLHHILRALLITRKCITHPRISNYCNLHSTHFRSFLDYPNAGCSNGSVTMGADLSSFDTQKRLKDILAQGIWVERNTHIHFLQFCTDSRALTEGKLVHAHLVSTGRELDVFLRNRFVHLYAKCGSLEDARHMFDKMSE